MPLLQCSSLSLTYDGLRRAVSDLSFEVAAGSLFALVGPNGAGKTSTLRMLATLTEPSGGEIIVDDIPLSLDREGVRRRVGYLPDHFALYDSMTPVECLDFFGRCYGVPDAERRRRIDDLLEELDLTTKRGSAIRELSRGMRQRLGIAKTLVHDPKLLLLDEPASALDPSARAKLRETLARLKRRGLAIILSSHILPDLAGLADAIGVMESGHLVRAGAVDEIARASRGERECYVLEVSAHIDRAAAAIADFGPRVLRCETSGPFRFEVELDGGANVVSELVEAIVLRGGRLCYVAPRDSEIEAIYRASAVGEVA